MEATICVVDRVEDGYAVCIPDDGSAAILLSADFDTCLREGAAVAVLQSSGEVCGVRPATPEEHTDRRQENAKRLRRLFEKHQ